MDITALEPNEVHVWRLRLPEAGTPAADSLLSRLRPRLAADELTREAKFAIEPARVQYVIARVALRELLAGYCDTTAASIQFDKAERGKPSARDLPVRFNVSHSGRVALIAVSRDLEIGVDVEQVWQDDDPYRLADRYFSANELAALTGLPEAARTEAFFWIWTRKEAYIKARGDGLFLGLDSFDVTCGPHPSPQLLASRKHPDDVARFAMFNIDVDAEYPASLLAERREGRAPTLRIEELAPEEL